MNLPTTAHKAISHKPSTSASFNARRGFLKSSALTIAFSLSPFSISTAQSPAKPVLPGSLNTNRMLDGWLRINANGTVTMFTGKVELGQGILTALTQIVSDELDVDLKRIEVVSGNTSRTANEGVTSGSLSIQDSGTALRFASAEARGLLLQAAAVKLGAAVGDLKIADGTISSNAAKTTYWEITADAANEKLLQREATASVSFKPVSSHKLIGQSVQRRDILAKVTGGAAYVQDMRLPGMVFGRVVRPIAPRAKLVSVDEAAIKAMAGVVAVVRDGNFLAVAAKREEQAIAAARALQVSARWDTPGDLPPSGAALYEFLKQQPNKTDVVSEKKDAAFAAAVAASADAKTITAEFSKPYQAHASIGPSCAVAQWSGERLMVWCHSQGVFPLRADLAKGLRVPPANITVAHVEGSGCYGHNGADDVAFDAALLARALPGTPVKLQWTREDEFQWEPLGSPMSMKLQATLDKASDGSLKIASWSHELWSYTHSTRPGDADGVNLTGAWHIANPLPAGPSRNIPQPSGGSDRNSVPLYQFPQQKVTNHLLQSQPIRTSALRTLGAYANVFAAESFMDELADLAGSDPIAFRLKHLTDARAKAVLERAATMAKYKTSWGQPPAKVVNGLLKGRGVGFSKYKNLAVYCAVIVDVTVNTKTGAVMVDKAWSAVDAGLTINPDGFKNQIEGGIIQSASWTLYESMKMDGKEVLTKNWGDYPILRFPQVPQVQVEIINRPEERPLGVGEGSQGPTAAAIANAFANATGKRIRDLPMTAERVLSLLS